MTDTTVINLTDDAPMDARLLDLCRNILVQAAADLPIVCVSQSEEVPIGTNIRLGAIGRCWLSLYCQLFHGLQAVKTRWVAIAERDMLYTAEHFHWQPPTDDVFYHNENMWILQWADLTNHPEWNGMFSHRRHRMSLASMVCSRELLLNCISERLAIIENNPKARQIARRTEGPAEHLGSFMREHLAKYRSTTFKTADPIVDIRHDTNFSGNKRGNRRRPELPPWGTIADLRRLADA